MATIKVKIPPASAKRLDKNRKIVVEQFSFHHVESTEFPIPEEIDEFEFEYEEYHDPDTEYKLDADLYYRYYILYQNETGTRQEKIEINIEKNKL
jgi:hypothetical protein